ncbi:MAG TPA: hypothetical protein VNJ70_08185 [Thermoanaerobaculia bacterium]|nr:hypothetical protein [Thermoanaerobaculia bacterium]
MPDRPQLTNPPQSFDEAAGWRELFLLLIPDVPRRDAVDAMGRLLGDLLLEATGPMHADEPIQSYVRAAARDLQHVQHVLALEGKNAEDHEQGTEERRLRLFARRMARRIGRLAAGLEAAAL